MNLINSEVWRSELFINGISDLKTNWYNSDIKNIEVQFKKK